MKIMLISLLALFSVNSYARVVSSQCPKSIGVTFYDVAKVELNETIANDWNLKYSWDILPAAQESTQVFDIITRTESALCVYAGKGKVLYLQTNNFQDELMVTYLQRPATFFRLKVASFSPKHITLEKYNKLDLLAPIYGFSADSIEVIGEGKVGEAQSVEVQVNL